MTIDLPTLTVAPKPPTGDGARAAVPALRSAAFRPRRGLARGVVSVLAQPRSVAREAGHVARTTGRILRGNAAIAPSPRDKRFADPAWSDNPVYRRWAQLYLTTAESALRLVDDYATGGADWREVEEARFVANALISALAPTNTLVGNPAALKRALETGGRSVVRGLSAMCRDLLRNGGLPTQVDRRAFTVGGDLAVTPGAVVHREEAFELIQYAPKTPNVRERPLVIIPPPIGRYYFLDLAPGRSFVEYAVSQGLTVFMVSWRNPTKDQADWDLDTYAGAALSAIDVAREITGSPDVNTVGFCAGGLVMTTVLNHLAAIGDDRVHSAGYAVTMLDFHSRAPLGAFSAPGLVKLAARNSRKAGVISAPRMGAMFSWMRPDDLIFNYVVDQWLSGEPLPAFDILAWNADGTNLPAALHAQFLQMFQHNALAKPGAMTVLGTPVDLSRIDLPVFVTGALTDHITPWSACYRTTQLLSGPSTFVLSNAGHIASLVNPPGNPKASYLTGGPAEDAEAWQAGAERRTGSWWEPWAQWVLERSGDERPAPRTAGTDHRPALGPAPGLYVHQPARTAMI
jgi:polyhydroxyalkanoate synthase